MEMSRRRGRKGEERERNSCISVILPPCPPASPFLTLPFAASFPFLFFYYFNALSLPLFQSPSLSVLLLTFIASYFSPPVPTGRDDLAIGGPHQEAAWSDPLSPGGGRWVISPCRGHNLQVRAGCFTPLIEPGAMGQAARRKPVF